MSVKLPEEYFKKGTEKVKLSLWRLNILDWSQIRDPKMKKK